MSKKHFIELADALRDAKPEGVTIINGGLNTSGTHDALVAYAQWQAMVNSLAEFCRAQNPRFMRDRWIAYINGECGKNGGKLKVSVA